MWWLEQRARQLLEAPAGPGDAGLAAATRDAVHDLEERAASVRR